MQNWPVNVFLKLLTLEGKHVLLVFKHFGVSVQEIGSSSVKADRGMCAGCIWCSNAGASQELVRSALAFDVP